MNEGWFGYLGLNFTSRGYFIFRGLLVGSLFLGAVLTTKNPLRAEVFAMSPTVISCHNTKTGDDQKTITVTIEEQTHFSVITANATTWEWKIDGIAVANNSFPFLSMSWQNTGSHIVEARTGDGATWINPITWNITVRACTLLELATRFFNPNSETWFGPEWSSGGQDDFLLWGSNWLAFEISPWQDAEVKTVAVVVGGMRGTPPTNYSLRLENESSTALAWAGAENPSRLMPDSSVITQIAQGHWWVKFPLSSSGIIRKGQKYRIKLQTVGGGGDVNNNYGFRNMPSDHLVDNYAVVKVRMYFANEGYLTGPDINSPVYSDGTTARNRAGAYVFLDPAEALIDGMVYNGDDYPASGSQKIIPDNKFSIDMAGWLSSLRAGDIRKIELTENGVVIASKTETQPGYIDWHRVVNVVPANPLLISPSKNYLLQNTAISSQFGVAWYVFTHARALSEIACDLYNANDELSNLTWGGTKWYGDHYGQYSTDGAFLLRIHPVVGYWPQGANIKANERISLAFNKPMEQASTEGAFSVSPLVPGSFSWSGQNGQVLVFAPSVPFSANTLYTVTLAAGAMGAFSDPWSDVLGNGTRAPFTWTFHSADNTTQPLEEKTNVYPNPFIKGKNTEKTITFADLPPAATLRIYTISGDLIKTIKHKDEAEGGNEEWDISNAGSGVYLYVISSPEGVEQGKISVMK